ncbi:hypothetical protein AB3X55_08220 [Alphaproteobacteria bacterium LSUCC0719]
MTTAKMMAAGLLFGLVALVTGFVSTPAEARGGVEIVTVQSQGLGISQRDAVLDGVREAVSMVNGMAIASQTALAEMTTEVTTETDSSFLASSAFMEQISTATSGIVESYNILSSGTDAGTGLVTVNLSVQVARYQTSKQLDRLRMALSGILIDNDVQDRAAAAEFAEDLQDGVIDYLTQTRRFAMIDRQLMAETQAELNYVATANVPTRELARLGNRVGTDYLVVIELRDLVTTVTERQMATTNRVRRKTVLTSEVGVRIIDVATSQIKFSGTVDTSATTDYRDLARSAARAIGRYVQNAIYPIRIVAIDGNVLTLGQGGKTIDQGERYSLIRLGERMYDPYSKESLGYKETTVGTVVITTVRAKQSKAEIETFDGGDMASLTGYEYVVRPLEPAPDADLKAARERVKKAREQSQSLKDKFDN